MKTKAKILIVDDDNLQHGLLKEALIDFDITSAFSGKEALSILKSQDYDLILLDVGMGDINGYEVCKKIRTRESRLHVPVLFLSGKKSLEDIVQGYESGGTDYLTKPFKLAELIAKIRVEIETFYLEKDLQSNLSEVTEAVLTVQSSNAKIYSICRFLQQSFFCQDIESLCQLFFTVTKSFGTDATLYIHGEKNSAFYASSGKQHAMSNAILEQVHAQGGRIIQFGKDRAVFNWELASLLVNHMQDNVDNLALLMDGFEMGLKAIEASSHFETILDDYREVKYQQSIKVTTAFDEVVDEIQEELGQIGYNPLSEEQEIALVRIVESKRDMVDKLFNQGVKLDQQLSTVMQKLRSDTKVKQQEEDGIEFL